MLVFLLISLAFTLSSFAFSLVVLPLLQQKLSQNKSSRFLFKEATPLSLNLKAESGFLTKLFNFRQLTLKQAGQLLTLIAVVTTVLLFFLPLFYIFLLLLLMGAAFVFYLQRKEAKRLELLGRQLPLVLKYLSSGLTAGYSLFQALKYTANNLPEPMQKEIAATVEQISLGLSVEDAFANLSLRVPLPEAKLIFLTILIQKKTGGNLVTILKQAQAVLEERQKLKNELLTQTAQVRFSSSVVGGLPFIVLIFMLLTDPAYVLPLFQTQLGQLMLSIALLAEVSGYLLIKRLMVVPL